LGSGANEIRFCVSAGGEKFALRARIFASAASYREPAGDFIAVASDN